MSIAGIVPGWLIGYLVEDDGETCSYRTLHVVSVVVGDDGSIDPIIMTPDGQTLRADDIPGRAFAAGPTEDVRKIALAHALTMQRGKIELGARAAA